jgi:photosystem II stability/assembly factor-like uncharacterized protein
MEPRRVWHVQRLALMAAAVVGLATIIAVYLRPVALPSPVPQPDLASDIDWISAREGWLSVFDRPGGRTLLLHTTDGGAHWSRQRVASALETVDFLDGQAGFLASRDASGRPGPIALYRSRDGGRHWGRVDLPGGGAGGPPSFVDARDGWAWEPSPPGLYATADGGAHWRRLDAAGLPDLGPRPGSLWFRDAAHGWAALPAGDGPPALYATADGGESWTELPLPAPAGGWPAGSRFEVGPPAIAPDGRGHLQVTELVPWEFRQVVLAHWVAATGDAGVTWSAAQRLPDTPPETLVGSSTGRADGSACWAWSTDELVTTRDGGGHWTALAVPPGWRILRVQAIDAVTAWVAASVADGRGNARWRLFSTGDAGISWHESRLPGLR